MIIMYVFLLCIFTMHMNTEQKNTEETQIYLAPLQGFTDFIYRKCYHLVFPGIDAFFIPYISVQNESILNKYKREILAENNPQDRVVPQVLVKNANEILLLAELVKDTGYEEINLNLGCPYPMVTNRRMGAGMLPHPEILEEILTVFFEKTDLKLSVKLRAGLTSPKEIKSVIPVLNRFPLTEVILHSRIAKQLYSGTINYEAFDVVKSELNHNLIYNGDITTVGDFREIRIKFPGISGIMMGRGVLMNPFLPAEIKGKCFTATEKKEKLIEFHQLMVDDYAGIMDNEGNVLNKMKQFWSYFISNFPGSQKYYKQLKKARSLKVYYKISGNILDSMH